MDLVEVVMGEEEYQGGQELSFSQDTCMAKKVQKCLLSCETVCNFSMTLVVCLQKTWVFFSGRTPYFQKLFNEMDETDPLRAKYIPIVHGATNQLLTIPPHLLDVIHRYKFQEDWPYSSFYM